jgi:5-methylcytosine-specific restriction endonuclease McrA
MRDLRPNGNFCSQSCFKLWETKNKIDPKIIKEKDRIYQNAYAKRPYVRIKRNEYIKEWAKRKRRENPDFQERFRKRQIKKIVKLFRKRLSHLLRIPKKFVCLNCKIEFIDDKWKDRKYCSKKCSASAHKIYSTKPKCKGIRKELFEKIKESQDYKCAICGNKEPFLDQYWHYLTQDHIIPRSKGGKKRSKENIQALCWNCNIKKSNKL